MKTILDKVRCYIDMSGVLGNWEVKDGGIIKFVKRMPLPILEEIWVAYKYAPEVKIKVKVLLDTGNDLTIIKPETLENLEQKLREEKPEFPFLPVSRHINRHGYYGNGYNAAIGNFRFQPSYNLSIFLTDEHSYSSEYGIHSPKDHIYDDIDIWLGLDIFDKLVITFDGVYQTVTISEHTDDELPPVDMQTIG